MQSLDFGSSLLVTVIGMAIVFLGLTVLIFTIKLLSKATERLGLRKPKARPRQAPNVPMPKAPMPAPAAEEAPAEDDGALVAAITAAIALMLEGEKSGGSGFVVRRIRRLPR